jgi:hypothetical protein
LIYAVSGVKITPSDSIGLPRAALFFRIRNARYSGASDCGTELADHDAAWTEMTKVCGDLAGSLAT